MHPLIRERLPQIIEICKRHRVRRAALFGSAVHDDFEPGRSDIDLLIDFEPLSPGDHYEAYFSLIEALEGALARPVDVVERESLRNPYLRRAAETSQILLYDAA